MSNQRVEEYIPLDGGGADVNNLEVSVYYSLGGMNYFTSRVEPRGIYVSVTPMFKAPGSRKFTAFSGTKMCVKELKRFSQKTFNTAVASDEVKQAKAKLVDVILGKNPHLTLIETSKEQAA